MDSGLWVLALLLCWVERIPAALLIPTAGLGAQSCTTEGQMRLQGPHSALWEPLESPARVAHPAVSLCSCKLVVRNFLLESCSEGETLGQILSKGRHMCGPRAETYRMEMPHTRHSLGVLKGIKIGRIPTALCVQKQAQNQLAVLRYPLYLCPLPPSPPPAAETLILTDLGQCPMPRRSGE